MKFTQHNFGIIGIFLLSMVVFSGCQKEIDFTSPTFSNRLVEVGALGSGESCVPLIAGQHTNAGSLCFADQDTNGDGFPDLLIVTYTTSGTWSLKEIHLWVGETIAQLPMNNGGNPQIGLFPYKQSNLSTNTISVEIPFADLGYDCADAKRYFVAAHAVVQNGNGGTQTAWADGDRLSARGNWAMYMGIWISCDAHDNLAVSSETAWAKLNEGSTCFLNIGELQSNNWGWSNGLLSEGSYTLDLIAGAGQCNGGVNVGTVTVVYSNGSAEIFVNVTGVDTETGVAYTLDEVHVYAGNAILPTGNNGNLTSAPGQLGNNSGSITGASEYSLSINNLSDDIYIAVHAVVSGFPL